MLDALADDVGATLEVDAGELGARPRLGSDEDLPQRRHGVPRQRAQRRLLGRHGTPPQHHEAFLLDDLLDADRRLARLGAGLRKEGDAGDVLALGGQVEIDDGAVELVRNLDQDPRTVTGVGFRTGGATMLQIQQRGDRLVDDVAAAAPVHVDDERDATGVVLVGGVVEAHRPGDPVAWKLVHT